MIFKAKKSIFISLSPNVQKDDFVLALKLLFMPWKWKKGMALERLELDFKRFLNVKHVFVFNSGRIGFLAILRALGLKRDDEVLIQGFTCNAVVNPILWSGLKPVFVDIDKQTLNFNFEELEKKITNKTQVILLQHTFGLPADIDRISAICREHNITLLEDCAHSLGAEHNGKKIGSFGKASFFSFGRDKVISSVYGGFVATNDNELAEKIKTIQENFDYPSRLWIFQQLLHPVLNELLIKPFYGFFGLGRWILLLFQKTHILSKAVSKKEKVGERAGYLFKKMPNGLAILALNQFKKLDKIIKHQKDIVFLYKQGLVDMDLDFSLDKQGRIYIRYPILVKKGETDDILKQARKQKIFLNDGWRKAVVVPLDTDQRKMGYRRGICPVAEDIANRIINLPTHIGITKENAEKIVNFLKANAS